MYSIVDTVTYFGIFCSGYSDICLGEIEDQEFENHKNLKKCIFRTLEQAGTNICSIG